MALTKVKLIADGVITSANLDASHGITTSDIGEGSNLYYTDSRVSSYLSTNGFATQTDIVAAITDSAPVTLDTLNELAAALGDDPNFATTTATSLGLKAPLASPSFTGNATFAGSVNAKLSNIVGLQNMFNIENATNTSVLASFGLNLSNDQLILGSDYAASFLLKTGGTTAITIDTSQNTTFAGDIYIDEYIYHNGETTNNISFTTGNFNVTVGGNLKFNVDANNTYFPQNNIIISSGNVGIGAAPSTSNKLHIQQAKSGSSAENYDLLRFNLTGTGAIGDSSSIVWYSTSGIKTAGIEGISGQDNILYGELAFNVRKYTTDSFDEVMRINNRGNVGIGTTSPTANYPLTLRSKAGDYTKILDWGTDVGGSWGTMQISLSAPYACLLYTSPSPRD